VPYNTKNRGLPATDVKLTRIHIGPDGKALKKKAPIKGAAMKGYYNEWKLQQKALHETAQAVASSTSRSIPASRI